jgi:hypothetical protein
VSSFFDTERLQIVCLPFWSVRRWPLAMLVLDQLWLARLSRRYKKQMGL